MTTYYKYFPWILIIVYFMYLLVDSLIQGGGWDLNQHIAFADRIIHHGMILYSGGDIDLYMPSSPYFPGIGLLSYIIMIFGLNELWTSYVLLILANFVGFTYLVSIYYITKKLYPKLNSTIIVYTLTFIYIVNFSSYKQYMLEFKPDTLILLCINIVFLVMYSKLEFIKKFFIVSILLLIAIPFKQTFFFVYLAFLLIVFLNKDISLKNKIYIVIIIFLFSSFILLWMFSSIDNLYYFTVEVMKHHVFDMTFFIRSIKAFIIRDLLFNVLLFIYLIKYFKNDIFSININIIKLQYLIVSLFFMVFSVLGAMKTGGNRGNLEVGFIVFLPFIVYTLTSLITLFQNQEYFKKISCISILIFIVLYGYKAVNNVTNLDKKNYEILEIKNNISKKIKHKNYCLVNGTTLIYVMGENGFKNISEKGTISHFNNMINYDMKNLLRSLNDKEYDLLLFSHNIEDEFTSVFTYTNTGNYKKIIKIINEKYKYYKKYNLYFYTPKD